MCGICGVVSFDNKKPVDTLKVKKMCDQMVHRGPDDEGIYVKDNVGLGHRRLSIIDLSPSARQPMPNEDESLWIVFNGEIYNFKALTTSLKAKGHRFRSHSDTEVILHLYEDMGPSCVGELRGMFAFAIWDEPRKRLLMARDRLGKKPLFYYYNERTFIFASEISAILRVRDINTEFDYCAIEDYFAYQYIPSPRTIYKFIKKLPPAHTAILDGNTLKLERYWDTSLPSFGGTDERNSIDELMSLLTEAVHLRMISDVPLGAFLSGGIDSSVIVGLMSQKGAGVKTFTVGFPDPTYDERDFARGISRFFNTEHKEDEVIYDIQERLPAMLAHFGEPFGDYSAVPTYYLCETTRQAVTVALSGDGGDEIFGGYRRYMSRKFIDYYLRVPKSLRRNVIEKFLMMFPIGTEYYAKSIMKSARLFIEYAKRVEIDRFNVAPVVFNGDERKRLFSPELREMVKGRVDYVRQTSGNASSLDEISHMMWTDIHTYLPDDILVKVDRMSMAHSLEVRSPFLDHKVVEYVSGLPISMKLRGLKGKYLLRQCAKHLLPKGMFSRKKQGFMVPLSGWIKNELKDYVEGLILAENDQYFQKKFLKDLLHRHYDGKADNSHKIWLVMAFKIWYEAHKKR